MDALATALQRVAEGGCGVVALVVSTHGHAPQRPGARLWIGADGERVGTVGGGAVEAAVITRAATVSRPTLIRLDLTRDLGMCCGGVMEVFLEPIGPAPRLVLCGAGHVGRATAEIAALAGFRVVVVDERPDQLTDERFPAAERRVGEPVAMFVSLGVTAGDAVVVTTHDHALDEALVVCAVRAGAGFVGLIGSDRKARTARAALAAAGLETGGLRCPVGVAIGAETPEEIGVSIVGALIAWRRGSG